MVDAKHEPRESFLSDERELPREVVGRVEADELHESTSRGVWRDARPRRKTGTLSLR